VSQDVYKALYFFVKNSLIGKWRDLSPPNVGHCWIELDEQILVCLFLFSLSFACDFCFTLDY